MANIEPSPDASGDDFHQKRFGHMHTKRLVEIKLDTIYFDTESLKKDINPKRALTALDREITSDTTIDLNTLQSLFYEAAERLSVAADFYKEENLDDAKTRRKALYFDDADRALRNLADPNYWARLDPKENIPLSNFSDAEKKAFLQRELKQYLKDYSSGYLALTAPAPTEMPHLRAQYNIRVPGELEEMIIEYHQDKSHLLLGYSHNEKCTAIDQYLKSLLSIAKTEKDAMAEADNNFSKILATKEIITNLIKLNQNFASNVITLPEFLKKLEEIRNQEIKFEETLAEKLTEITNQRKLLPNIPTSILDELTKYLDKPKVNLKGMIFRSLRDYFSDIADVYSLYSSQDISNGISNFAKELKYRIDDYASNELRISDSKNFDENLHQLKNTHAILLDLAIVIERDKAQWHQAITLLNLAETLVPNNRTQSKQEPSTKESTSFWRKLIDKIKKWF